MQTFDQWHVTILRDLPRAFPTLGDLRETLEVALKDEEIGEQFFRLLDFINTDGSHILCKPDKAQAAQKGKENREESGKENSKEERGAAKD